MIDLALLFLGLIQAGAFGYAIYLLLGVFKTL
jgi:hypothetical protein